MANKTNGLEAQLNELFEGAPKLPIAAKRALVEWTPIISLVIGFLTILAAWSLWHWARIADTAAYYAGTMCGAYTGYTCPTPVSRFSVWLWLSIAFLAIEGLFYIFAYPKLKDRKKEGWNYLYYGVLVNVACAVVSLFTSYDVFGHFVGALIDSAIGFYFLFQIRDSYLGSKRIAPSKPTDQQD